MFLNMTCLSTGLVLRFWKWITELGQLISSNPHCWPKFGKINPIPRNFVYAYSCPGLYYLFRRPRHLCWRLRNVLQIRSLELHSESLNFAFTSLSVPAVSSPKHYSLNLVLSCQILWNWVNCMVLASILIEKLMVILMILWIIYENSR